LIICYQQFLKQRECFDLHEILSYTTLRQQIKTTSQILFNNWFYNFLQKTNKNKYKCVSYDWRLKQLRRYKKFQHIVYTYKFIINIVQLVNHIHVGNIETVTSSRLSWVRCKRAQLKKYFNFYIIFLSLTEHFYSYLFNCASSELYRHELIRKQNIERLHGNIFL
jgi:hypothetical protein